MTQNEQILAWLRHDPITQQEALQMFGCMRLASRINDLRNAGHNIVTHKCEVLKRNGEFAMIAEYHLMR